MILPLLFQKMQQILKFPQTLPFLLVKVLHFHLLTINRFNALLT